MNSSRLLKYWPNMAPTFFSLLVLFCLLPYSGFTQTKQEKLKEFTTNAQSFKHKSREDSNLSAVNSNCGPGTFRTIDGTCNNAHPDRSEWGATDIALWRNIEANYGGPDFFNDMAGQNRLSARAVSNIVVAQPDGIPSARGLSSFVFSWGQFLDHDIDLTPESAAEYVPIALPPNEPLFTSEIPFSRSEVYTGSGVNSNRQQINLITSWVDGSNVYGAEESRAAWLRTFVDGKLKTSAGNLLPYNTIDGEKGSTLDPNAPSMAGDGGGVTEVFVTGDVRGVEQSTLTALHTLFVREHNRICDELLARGYSDDEFIYQVARKQVGAIIQAITYQEFLPALGVFIAPYNGYRQNVRPDISNIFATAAYRLGHTMVPEELLLRDNNCREVGPGSLSLIEAFFDTAPVETYGIDAILKGLSVQVQQEIDPYIVDELRNFLFAIPGSSSVFGLDLASLNIQRGRDHGLPDYNSIRAHYIGNPAFNFQGINNNPTIVNNLRQAYQNKVNNIDAWVGLLSEKAIPGGSVGATMHAILKEQFENLRNGDFFYFENDPFFTRNDKDQIRRTRLSDILRRNTNIQSYQENVFFAEVCRNGGGPGNGPGNGGGNNGGGRAGEVDNTNRVSGDLAVFPNPAQEYVTLAFYEEGSTQMEVKLLTMDGEIVYQKNYSGTDLPRQLELDISDKMPGVYVLSVRTNLSTYVKRFVLSESR